MSKKYIAVATMELVYEFDEDEIENGMTYWEWAEHIYEHGSSFVLDGHKMDVKEV